MAGELKLQTTIDGTIGIRDSMHTFDATATARPGLVNLQDDPGLRDLLSNHSGPVYVTRETVAELNRLFGRNGVGEPSARASGLSVSRDPTTVVGRISEWLIGAPQRNDVTAQR